VETGVAGVRSGCVAAFALEGDEAERLAVVAEVAGDVDPAEAVERIRRAVAEGHDLPLAEVALLAPGTLPKTSSGKLQRGECRRLLRRGELAPLHAWRLSEDRPAEPGPERPPSAPDELVGWLRRFGTGGFDPVLADERRSLSPHAVLELGNRGLFGLQLPPRWGGLGLGAADAARIYEQLGALDLTLASLVCGHNTLGVRPLHLFGTDAQREALLPALAAGRLLAGFALTEPGAGSNPRAIASRAEPAGEGRWRLYGEKTWIGTATWAGVLTVFVSHAGGGSDGGVSAFLLRPGAPGLRLGPELPTLGLRGMAQSRVRMEGVEVGADALLGRPGEGMEIAQEALASARLALSAVCLGGLERCAQLMARFAARRTISTGVLAEHPVARERIGGALAAAGALSALVAKLARRTDDGPAPPAEALMAAKIAASELLWEAADGLVQLMGGRGYVDPGHPARILRDARAFRIVEGPTEVLTAFLGARAHRQPGATRRLVGEVFGGEEIAESLHAAAAALARRSPEADPRWTHHGLGWLLVDGLLAAAAEEAAAGRGDGAPERRAAAWARRRLDQRLAEALGPGAAPPSAGELWAEIQGLNRAVGEPDWAWIGEEHAPEPMLGAGAPAGRPALAGLVAPDPPPAAVVQARPPAAKLPRAPGSARGNGGRAGDADAVAGWLRRWIAGRRGVAPEAVEADLPFEYHGIDSVSASEMIAELGEHLGQPLLPTLLWAHPSIAALARHLGR
ncbi:MAG TPA: acyl-CoA dehydrogenase family protein, partial [Longimicrobium sp.]|nr:acyl-CoA dehydrogenase family protein [Longimicrobium sp.]